MLRKAYDLMFALRTSAYRDDLGFWVAQPNVGFGPFLDKDAEYEIDGLRSAYQAFLNAATEGPQTLAASGADVALEDAPYKEQSERRAEMQREVLKHPP